MAMVIDISVSSISKTDNNTYQVMYHPIPFRPSAVKGYIFLNDRMVRFQFDPHLRKEIFFGGDCIVCGYYSPETGIIVFFFSESPGFHWLSVFKEDEEICWMKEGF